MRHLSFTGSTAVGRHLHAECAKTFKKTSMELGGNAPFIVFGDADLGKAVEGELPFLSYNYLYSRWKNNLTVATGVIASKFRSSGQTCVCANRIFVHSSIINMFAELLSTKVHEAFHFGSVWDPKCNFGPLYSEKAFDKVNAQIQDAIDGGATAVLGGGTGNKTAYGPNFFPPTIIKNARPEMLFMKQETFGPVAFLVPFDTDEEALSLANDTDAGLAAYFYTEDISRVWTVSEELEAGMVGVRVGLISACEQPFGGIKDSGTGREGGKNALDEYTEVKSVTLAV